MAGEFSEAKRLVEAAMGTSFERNASSEKNTMGQALIAAVIQSYSQYRSLADIRSELQFTIDNLNEDEFVITRGS